MDTLLQLYPQPTQTVPFKGAYLAHDLRQLAAQQKRPYIYGNFVASSDGRIAVPHPTSDGMVIPQNVANERDWRLFQELAAQADLLISSGRYLRDWADGRAQEILQVDDPAFADLRQWRVSQGLTPQPDIAIISGSLDFPIPDVLQAGGRRVVVFTGADPDPRRVKQIEAQAGQVYVVGDARIDGRRMMAQMAKLGYQTVYASSGPKILHMLLAAGALNRLYLTQVNRLLGGDPFSSIVQGPLLATAVDLHFNNIYLDAKGADGLDQLFVSYDCATP